MNLSSKSPISKFPLGLRVDVDTYRGTRYGVPAICKLLGRYDCSASFFFSVGPDNMGRHLWRLLRPAFFLKMLRTRAASLYGWDILLKGTLWPGPEMGKKLAHIILNAAQAGHEVGLHAWDHHAWQAHIDHMTDREVFETLHRGVNALAQILGKPPVSSAAPAWKCTETVLLQKARFPFTYNSDCRGSRIFYPVVEKQVLSQVQIPQTLPTYDETVGQNGITDQNYNDHLLSLLRPNQLNVLTIHAEVEGIVCLEMFDAFIKAVRSFGAQIISLGKLLEHYDSPSEAPIERREISGREGWVAWQY
jgi:undecaprenyl phosphate-alpha-L-ara4FN deformylase